MNSGPKWSLRHGSQYRRLCARPGCGAPAAATLRFQSTQRQAWLVELDENAARTQGDLCRRHAAALVLPRGWELHDDAPGAAHVRAARRQRDSRRERSPSQSGRGARLEPVVDSRTRQPRTGSGPRAGSAECRARDADAAARARPQFGPNDEDDPDVEEALGEILDARTPLLQRAFRNAKPNATES